MDIAELQALPMPDLIKMGRGLEVPEIAGLPKHELIFKILAKQAAKEGVVLATGVLEILPDGYGFLRSASAS